LLGASQSRDCIRLELPNPAASTDFARIEQKRHQI
jgi:hypothetical protein